MEPYGGVKVISRPEDEGRRIGVGQYEFQKSSTALPPPFGMEIGEFGDGISYFKGGKYIGYHTLPRDIFALSLEEIVETAEFKVILRKIAP